GGCFVAGGGSTYEGFAAWIAEITGADVYLPDYRLAPEHPYPAPLDDLFEAYRVVLGLRHPAKRVAILGVSGGSVSTNDRADPMVSIRFLESGARAHAAGLRLTDPQVSPLFGELKGLP